LKAPNQQVSGGFLLPADKLIHKKAPKENFEGKSKLLTQN
jgi:hypothetical protein